MVSSRSRRLRQWMKVLAAALVCAGVLGGGLFALNRRSLAKEQAAIDKRKVKVERKDVRKELTLTGKVLPSSSVAVYSPVSGQVKEIFVPEGARVALGQNLFSVIQDASGQRELEATENEVESARLELRIAEEALERRSTVQDLFSDADNRKAQDEVGRRRLAAQAAREKLDLLRERLGLRSGGGERGARSAGKAGSVIYVKAPKSGVVTFINKAVGESVLATTENADATGREVLTLSDLEKMIVRSRILESDLASVKTGMNVKLRLDAFRDKEYGGTVSRISQQGVEDKAAGYTYFVTDVVFERPDQDVRSQMNASINLVVAEKKKVLTLPAIAVATLSGHSVVELPPDGEDGAGKSEGDADGKNAKDAKGEKPARGSSGRRGRGMLGGGGGGPDASGAKREGPEPRYRKVSVGLSTETLVEITDPAIKEGEEFLEIDFSRLDLKALAQGTLGDNDKVTERQL